MRAARRAGADRSRSRSPSRSTSGRWPTSCPAILARYGAPLEAGDAILCNDSHLGGLHLNDVCLVAPLIVDGRPFAYAVAMAHHVDVGGGTPGSIGLHREQIQEGLIIPPVRIMHDGVVDPGVLAMLVANVRSPRETEGDLRAQLASVTIGLRRLGELIDERGARGGRNAASTTCSTTPGGARSRRSPPCRAARSRRPTTSTTTA